MVVDFRKSLLYDAEITYDGTKCKTTIPSLPMDMPGKYLESVIYWQTRFKSGGSLLSVKVSRCSISLYYVGTVATVLR